MSSTLLRFGMWLIVLVFAAYTLTDAVPELNIGDYLDAPTLGKLLALAVLLVIIGIVLRIFEKGAKAVAKNRCQVCRTPIPPGAIYCRAHLRNILHEEDDRTHLTRIR
ncbi:MAG TPA: hypothetical protein VF698_21175 [Thermoanaerobaculia bacterium]|jgi:hypothetical protein